MNLIQWFMSHWRTWRAPPAVIMKPTLIPELLTPNIEEHKYKKHKEHDFTYHHLRGDVSEQANYILDRFSTLQVEPGMMNALEELWGCDFLLRDKKLGERLKGGDRWGTVDGVSALENAIAVWPIEHAFCSVEDGYITLTRITSVAPHELRGKVMRVLPHMVRVVIGNFGDSGHWQSTIYHFGLVGDRWIYLGYDEADALSTIWAKHYDEEIKMLLPCVLAARYEWHVAFGLKDGGPRILLPTNPSGCLQLFKNRDLPEGKTRRDALRHWVEEHWREGKDTLAYVCHHLRGHTRFIWYDLDCELLVSAHDLEKNSLFHDQAHEWRSKRKHNRVRVKLKKVKR